MNTNENLKVNKEESIEEKRLNLIMEQKELNSKLELMMSSDYLFEGDSERLKLDKEYFKLAKERDLVEQALLSMILK